MTTFFKCVVKEKEHADIGLYLSQFSFFAGWVSTEFQAEHLETFWKSILETLQGLSEIPQPQFGNLVLE